MLSRKAVILLILLLLFVFLAFGTWLAKAPAQLYSNPAMLRTNDNYINAHAPGKNPPAFPTNLFSSVQIERRETQITLKIPTPAGSSSDFAFGPIRDHTANSSHLVRLESGSLHLAYIATAHAAPKTNFDYSLRIPANFYTPDGKRLGIDHPLDPIPKYEYERELGFDGDFPAAKFFFIRTNLSEFKILRFGAFDARTHFPLTFGYGSSSLSNLYWFSCSPRLWHQTPIELVVLAATGPVQTYSLEPREGAEVRHPGGSVRLLLLSERDLNSWGSTSDGRTNTISFQINQADSAEASQVSLVFYAWPTAFNSPFELECLGADGKPLPSRGGGASDRFNIVNFEGRISDIKGIRLKYYPNIHRLSFTIPELPGLPDQNRNIKNLFNVHIPYMRFRYENNFQENIAALVQMQNHHAALTFTNGYFPTARFDTTPRELFHEMETLLSDQKLRLVANPTENKIQPAPNTANILFQRFRQSLGLK